MSADHPGWAVIDAAVDAAHARLGDGLRSAYAIGSLAHGGFSPSVSDVDLALLTDDRPDRDLRRTVALIAAEVARDGGALAGRLSIFHAPWTRFGDPPSHARLPPIDRYDLVHFGILVAGDDLRAAYATEPTADEIRAHAVDSALRRATPAQLTREVRALSGHGATVHDATKLVLWPVRLQHVADTARATGNAAAVEHYRELPDADHRALVADALAWREHRQLPDRDEAVRRITAEIHGLHAEVFTRLGAHPEVPRQAELAGRAAELTR